MSASNIPNLNSLRTGGRGAARGGFSGRTVHLDKDAVVRNTDSDAATSRMSAVEAGYLDDPFAVYLTDETWRRRLPLMNRGTYVRTTAIDRVVDTFLRSTHGPRQIVSLGAGSDTRYFRLKREAKHANFTYHEVDFLQNNNAKVNRLKSPQCLQTVRTLCNVDLETAEITDGGLRSPEYSIHPIDLRKLPNQLNWLDASHPTLFISECCLIYLTPEEADQALSYLFGLFSSTPLAIVIYEPFRPNDPFGKTMIRNLTSRGIVLQTIEKYSDIEEQRHRLIEQGFESHAVDTNLVWQSWVSHSEKERIDKLEWMDEMEEFELLAKHYCVAWGWRQYHDDTLWQSLDAPA